jgi:KEOPS complex subunit Pcc1
LTDRAELSFRTEHPEVIIGALLPELSEKIPRTKVTVERAEGAVMVKIEAEDQTALRAALNSYIRWMNVAAETAKEAGRR